MRVRIGTFLDDKILGGNFDEVVAAFEGDDIVFGGGGNDVIFGDDGDDQLFGDGDSMYFGPSGNDVLSGGSGNDSMFGGAGIDSFDGGEGQDRVSFFSFRATQGAVANLITQTISNDGFGNAETMFSVEFLGAGTAFADIYIGNDETNIFRLGLGDIAQGNGGADIFEIGLATALIDGGSGGGDILALVGDFVGTLIPDNNGDGLAELVFVTEGYNVDLHFHSIFDGFGNFGVIQDVENVEGSEFGDGIFGDNGSNILNGWGGEDHVVGGGGSDLITGGEGGDLLRGDGSVGVIGPGGDDQLFGDGGDDIIHGDGGDDLLEGGAGGDFLSGEAGADTFVYTSLADSVLGASDTILDFSRLQGDKLDFAAIDANGLIGGDQAFHIVEAFTHAAGELTISAISGAQSFLQMDVNGDGVADMQMLVNQGGAPITGIDLFL